MRFGFKRLAKGKSAKDCNMTANDVNVVDPRTLYDDPPDDLDHNYKPFIEEEETPELDETLNETLDETLNETLDESIGESVHPAHGLLFQDAAPVQEKEITSSASLYTPLCCFQDRTITMVSSEQEPYEQEEFQLELADDLQRAPSLIELLEPAMEEVSVVAEEVKEFWQGSKNKKLPVIEKASGSTDQGPGFMPLCCVQESVANLLSSKEEVTEKTLEQKPELQQPQFELAEDLKRSPSLIELILEPAADEASVVAGEVKEYWREVKKKVRPAGDKALEYFEEMKRSASLLEAYDLRRTGTSLIEAVEPAWDEASVIAEEVGEFFQEARRKSKAVDNVARGFAAAGDAIAAPIRPATEEAVYMYKEMRESLPWVEREKLLDDDITIGGSTI